MDTRIIYTDQQRNKIIKKMNEVLEMKVPEIPAMKPLRTGRNELCPCGNGKKYKKCHLWEDQGYKISGGEADEG